MKYLCEDSAKTVVPQMATFESGFKSKSFPSEPHMKMLGMQDIGFFAVIRYADHLQLILSIIDSDADIYVYFFPRTYLQKSSSLFCRGIYIQYCYQRRFNILLPCWAAGKCRHKIKNLKLCNIHSLCKRKKILELTLCKTCHIYLWRLLSNKTSKIHPT